MENRIRYFNRYTSQLETELVYGEGALRWCYESMLGRALLDHVIAKPVISKVYGAYKSTAYSARALPAFIDNFKINMSEYENGPFRSFNDFFIRKFKPGKRTFTPAQNELAAPAEGRYFGYSKITEDLTFPVKGAHLTASALLGDESRAKLFEGGSLMVCRLCPVDYHRFHYPDDGSTVEAYPLSGKLYSVNPLALSHNSKIFIENYREVSVLKTKNFGYLAYVEVGATCVGKIVHTHHIQASAPVGEHRPSDLKNAFKRGDEKGYFLFGGSTVIILGEKGAWTPSDDILKNTLNRTETFVRLGDKIGVSAS